MPMGIIDRKMLDVVKMIAPGTELREGLENILRAGTGALIVFGDGKEVIDIVDGGFFIDKEYSAAHLYELAKMDGAIIISKDMKRIMYANALLIPDPTILTTETGTRHKSAERAAKQTGEVVISISQRRNIITIYKGHHKYIVQNTSSILGKANQALQALEKYKNVLKGSLTNLSILEFEDVVTLEDPVRILQRTEMALRIVSEIDFYVCELGHEGRLVKMQLEELRADIQEEAMLIIEDFIVSGHVMNVPEIFEHISVMTTEELADISVLCRYLGHYETRESLHKIISSRGYRLLSKVPKLPMVVMRNLVKEFGNLHNILDASIEELDEVDGIGTARAKSIKNGLRKVRDQLLLDNRYVL